MTESLRETLIQADTVFHGRLLTVHVDTVRLPNGGQSTREVVAHPGAVAMVALPDADHVLCVRQWRHAAGRALLELPAGTLSPGEEPAACAERELMEEIGYRPRRLTPLISFYLAPGYSEELLHVFLAEELTPERRPPDEDEQIEVVRLSWDEIAEMLTRGEFGDAKTVAGLLLAREVLKAR